jgi:hypothetical protein
MSNQNQQKGQGTPTAMHRDRGPQPCCAAGCCSMLGRRDFLTGLGLLGGSALAMHLGLFDKAVSQALGAAPRPGSTGQPLIRAAFTRQPVEKYYMGWPGAAYDIAASQRRYTEVLSEAAGKLGVKVDIVAEPLTDDATVDAFLESTADAKPDGVVLTVMGLHPSGWGQVGRFLEKRGDLPTIVFAPQGMQFTPTLQPYRTMPRMFLGATQDVEWLGTALRMLKTIRQMASTRIAVVHGEQEREEQLQPLGTTLQHLPLVRFAEAYDATVGSSEAKDIAAIYYRNAKGIVEPNEQEILEAARTYVANRQVMKAADCQAITMDCLGLVAKKRTPPPCMAYMQLLNEGTCGACERDITATLSLLLSSYLLDRPAFLHNPSPNTVRNTYMGAHCTAPTKMDGFDGPDSEYILRSHHESDWGVAPQVLLREGQGVTMMKFLNPGELMACTGTLLGNISTKPDDGVGGCRTAFEMSVDACDDTRDIRGHHNVLIYGKHMPMLKAYCQLSGLALSHITGGPV